LNPKQLVEPNMPRERAAERMHAWSRAVDRSKGWAG
jgi:glycerol kinase